jgi:hypothetical protein
MLVAPKVLVSMMSAPASRKRRWMSQIIFGWVREKRSPLFSRSLVESEARAADVGFLHAVGADGGAHRSIDDGDAALEDLLQRMLGAVAHLPYYTGACKGVERGEPGRVMAK